jgi:uncharacterized protein
MSKKIALKIVEIKQLRDIFATIPSIKTVWVYGSRARGDNQPYSDLDLLVSGSISTSDSARLAELLEESDLPFHVDIAVESQVQPEFLAEIRPECIAVYGGLWIAALRSQ